MQVGQTVQPGDKIALSGNTGLSTGAHLHWDMRIRGLNVDAMQFTRRVSWLLAVKKNNLMAIGVDVDQYNIYPEVNDALISSF